MTGVYCAKEKERVTMLFANSFVVLLVIPLTMILCLSLTYVAAKKCSLNRNNITYLLVGWFGVV